MKTEIKFVCDSPEEAATVLARFGVAAPATEADKPKGRNKNKAADPAPVVPVVPVVAVDPILGLPATASVDPLAAMLGNSAAQLPPVAMAAPVAAPIPAVTQAPAALSQQDVIKAFVTLGQTPGKGIDAVKALLVPYGVATVTAIKPEHFAHAVAAVKTALGQ